MAPKIEVVILVAFVALCLAQLPITAGLLSNAPKNVSTIMKPLLSQVSINAQESEEREKAIVVGGGPVGLASAIMLANHGYDVSVFEATPTEEIRAFNPALAYLYNVNSRGQVFTKMFPKIHEKLVERAIDSTQIRFMLAPADATKTITYPNMPTVGSEISYWIPRHEMTLLLWDAVDEHNNSRDPNSHVGTIDFEQGVSCVGVHPSNSREHYISVVVKDEISGEEKMVDGKLVVGADGIKSKVRKCLKEQRASLFGAWGYNAKKFQVKKWVSPATGLRLKALQVPTDKYSVADSDGTKVACDGKDIVAVRSKTTGPLDFLSLGSLPVNNFQKIRPANCITRPNHILWTLKSGAEVKLWFKENFPRLDFDDLISDKEWERFAKAEGLAFPPCQYCPGLQASPENGECGIVLLGDAAHSFSPDIGQGINAGLMDVVQFNEILANFSNDKFTKLKGSLGAALKEYERIRAPETRALIRIARFGSPYQYNQPLLKDRIGKKLWMANVAMRLLLNKITFGLFPKQMIFYVMDRKLTYRQIARRADFGTAGLMSVLAFAAFKLLVARNVL